MDLKTAIVKKIAKRRARQLKKYATEAKSIQGYQLKKITKALSRTHYGYEYGIKGRTSYIQYKRRIPLVKYEDIVEYIDRMQNGETRVLTDERTTWFAKSGGTTNAKSKYLPINRKHLHYCHYKGGLDTTLIYLLNHPESHLFARKAFALAGSYDTTSHNNKQIRTGDLSAVLLMKMPLLGRLIRVPSLDISLHPEWEHKLDLITDAIMYEDIGSISGVPSWMLSVIKELLRKSGCKTIKELWPNLEVFFHGGVAFTPYQNEYYKILGSGIHYQETYNASEGFFAIQDDPSDNALLLMLDYGVFYEFIPMSKFNEGNLQACPTVPLHEVEIGENYAMVISHLGGLYRYVIGDTVQFTRKDPYKITITGRTKSFINAFGEELMVTNADEALSILCNKLDCKIKEYTAGPVFLTEKGKGYHHWVMEWEQPPKDMKLFVKSFDETLQSLNSDYQAKRYKDFSLQPPVIDEVPEGTFYKWMKSNDKLGGQNKVVRLSKDDTVVKEILAMGKSSLI